MLLDFYQQYLSRISELCRITVSGDVEAGGDSLSLCYATLRRPDCNFLQCAGSTMVLATIFALALASASAAMSAQPDEASVCPSRQPDMASKDVADYIVVGGGTGGCALVARLCAALPQQSFILLERGTPRNDTEEHAVRSVRQAMAAWDMPNLTESWKSAPNPGLLGNAVDIYAGKTLGGTSSINAAQWTRPEGSIPAGWGISGLSAKTADRLYAQARAQLRVEVPPEELQQSYTRERMAAASAAGVEELEDPVGASRDSIWVNRLYADAGGRRRDSCTAYLFPLLGPGGKCRHNVQVREGVTASKIVTSGSRAVAVEYLDTSDTAIQASAGTRTVSARREVISCAGPYHSAKLLQLSGIGPRSLLEARGIPVVADLPVGEDAQVRCDGARRA